MANFTGICRTNYFHVTDEEKYRQLFNQLTAEDEIHDFTCMERDGRLLHGFGAYDIVQLIPLPPFASEVITEGSTVVYTDGEPVPETEDLSKLYVANAADTGAKKVVVYRNPDDIEEEDYDFSVFLKEMQKLIVPGEAFVFLSMGHEKLRYLNGWVNVVTQDQIEYCDLTTWAVQTAQKMLNNKAYQPKLEY